MILCHIHPLLDIIIHSTHYLFSDSPKAYMEFSNGRGIFSVSAAIIRKDSAKRLIQTWISKDGCVPLWFWTCEIPFGIKCVLPCLETRTFETDYKILPMLIINGKCYLGVLRLLFLKYCGVSFAVTCFTNINFLEAQKPEKGSNWATDRTNLHKNLHQ